MNREQAVKALGSVRELVKFLGLCGPHAVYNWKPKQRIPAKHELRIRDWMSKRK